MDHLSLSKYTFQKNPAERIDRKMAEIMPFLLLPVFGLTLDFHDES